MMPYPSVSLGRYLMHVFRNLGCRNVACRLGLLTFFVAACSSNKSTGPTQTNPDSGTVVFQSIFAGDHHACALTAAGVAYCWGKNDALQNGVGITGTGGQV